MPESRHYLFLVACAGMVVFGMILALPGTVIALPEFTSRFTLSIADRGVFIAALFGGLLAGSLLSGPVVDRAGYRRSIAGSTLAITGLLPAFAFAPTYGVALLALAGVGLAAAALNTSANALSSELFPTERGRRMNVIALCVSGGGLMLPTAIASSSVYLSWRAAIVGGVVVSAATATAAWSARFGPSRVLFAQVNDVAAPPRRLAIPVSRAVRVFMQQRGALLFCLLCACGAANEAAFAGWMSTYLVSAGADPVLATWGLSSHWLGLLAGRMIFARQVDRDKPGAIMSGASAGAAVLLLLVLRPAAAVLVVGPFAAGLSIAVVFPTSLALAGERLAGNTGTLFGLLLTMAQIGSIILPALVGALASLVPLRMALLLVVGNGALIAGLAAVAGSGYPTPGAVIGAR